MYNSKEFYRLEELKKITNKLLSYFQKSKQKRLILVKEEGYCNGKK